MSDRVLRCAVYTRKSTEEGLDMDFNSLQAQREACEAFIRSQRSEGWKLIPTAFDDGGISGGTMERPALRRLMAEIEEKKVDVVVVYKVDRLTRSLSDFSKMVEVFDRQGVSFVAVTQQFNTTTSMGRLTLNVLLSFAQFEREVTAERIRDKIAASKKKGIWMGGGLPRGYRVEDRKLIVVPEQAAEVNHIYRRFLEVPSVRELAIELKREGIGDKDPSDPKNTLARSRGALYVILRNPIYIGLIPHKGARYPGQHQGIVDRSLWDAVQEKLGTSHRCRGRPRRKTEDSPLIGKLFDAEGRRLMPTHATKRGARYRYYISHPDHQDSDRMNQKPGADWRLPAPEIEKRLSQIVKDLLADQAALANRATDAQLNATEVQSLLKLVADAKAQDHLAWIQRVDLRADSLTVSIAIPGRRPIHLEQTLSLVMKRRGVERRLVIAPNDQTQPGGELDPRLLRSLRVGLRCWEQMNSENPINAKQFAKQQQIDNRYAGRSLPLVFLAPDIVERFVAGRHSPDWFAERVLRIERLPLGWDEQRELFGMT